jgi:hypothetical protein
MALRAGPDITHQLKDLRRQLLTEFGARSLPNWHFAGWQKNPRALYGDLHRLMALQEENEKLPEHAMDLVVKAADLLTQLAA